MRAFGIWQNICISKMPPITRAIHNACHANIEAFESLLTLFIYPLYDVAIFTKQQVELSNANARSHY